MDGLEKLFPGQVFGKRKTETSFDHFKNKMENKPLTFISHLNYALCFLRSFDIHNYPLRQQSQWQRDLSSHLTPDVKAEIRGSTCLTHNLVRALSSCIHFQILF